MARFILYDLDPAFWQRVRAKAAAEGIQVKALILKLLTTWLGVFVLALLTTGCANGFAAPMALQPTPVAEDLRAPTSLSIGTLPGTRSNTTIVSARVQNLHGAPLAGMNVVFATTLGSLSPEAVVSASDGTASTTLTATDTARVSVTAGAMSNSTLIAWNGTPGQTPTPTTPTTPTLGLFLNVQGAAQTGDAVPFSVSSSALGATWNWTFGDGSADQTTAFATTHRYTRAGTYLATVFGTGASQTAAASASIVVTDKPVVAPPPTPAAFAAAIGCPKSTTQTQACNVSAIANGVTLPSNAITKISWDFGDGLAELGTSPAVQHAYAHPGTYTVFATVTATVSDGVTQIGTASTTVTVPSP
jgi:hypothetical protein